MSPADSALIEREKMEIARLGLVIDIWKKTVEVQQHFNDLALRIRNFALTLLVGVLGGTALALKDAPSLINFRGVQVSLASVLLGAGLIGWIGFWLLDRHWYHRLLVGAVKHGKAIEEAWTDLPLGLAGAIEKESHIVASTWYHKAGVIGALAIGVVGCATLAVSPSELLTAKMTVLGVPAAIGAAALLRRLLLPKWTLKARNRIDLFYAAMGIVLLTLAYVLRSGVPIAS